MVNEWTEHPLEQCMAAIIDYRGKTPRKTSAGIPLITAKVVKSGRIETPDEFIALEDYDAWMRRGMPKPNDVLITTEAPLGEVAQLGTEKVALAQRLIALRGKEGFLDNTFLKFLMQSRRVQDQLRARSSGTTVLGIRQSELRKISLMLPPFAEQQAIAKILGALDDKIELNRRMSTTLEGIARALFKSWFVDFDPVRAKAEGRGSYLPESIAALFPDSFEKSEIGDVPHSWNVLPLPEAIEVNPQRTLRRAEIAPYLDMSNMPTNVHAPEAVSDREFGSGMRFKNCDTLVARITPCLENGKTAYVDFLKPQQVGWGSTEYIVLRPKPPLPPQFAYYLARSNRFRDFAIQSMTGTSGRQRVPIESLRHFLIAIPPAEIASAFGRVVALEMERIRVAVEQSKTLAAIRDALLPKLISGELRVPDAERIAGGQV